jgi:hypothetical protein
MLRYNHTLTFVNIKSKNGIHSMKENYISFPMEMTFSRILIENKQFGEIKNHFPKIQNSFKKNFDLFYRSK